MPDGDSRARLVRFWRTVEMFSPQSVPKLSEITNSGGVLDVGPNELAPWEQGHPLRAVPLPEDRTWQFTVYGGRYDIGAARNELVRVFGADHKPEDARPGGETALFAFTLDGEGHMLPDTAVLSSCSWAVARLRSSGPGDPTWLDGFDEEASDFVAALNKLVPPTSRAKTVGDRSALREHAKGAVQEAVSAAANQVGDALGEMAATAVGSVAGSVAGGIVGKAVGAFVGSFLNPPRRGSAQANAPLVVPRLRMTGRALNAFVTDLAAAMDVAGSLRPTGVRVRCTRVPKKGGDEAEPAFLNSMIVEDLARIETAVRKGDCGAALGAYLADSADVPTSGRVDVRLTPAAVSSGVGPRDAPSGRWPTATTRPLVVSQQFAVNQIMREVAAGEGVFAVNGPPGTGKTTMLRDVLSAVVVERAGRLAALGKPADAFGDVVERVKLAPKYTAAVRALRPELTGFEIVVATASNDAAKNVTAEIPGLAAVSGAETDALAADYFSALAANVLNADAWGMIAAVLGSMLNRNTFTRRFWYGDTPPGRPTDEPVVGMRDILREVQADPGIAPDWDKAVTAFREAKDTVGRLADERQQVADRIDEHARHQAAIIGLTADLGSARDACDKAKTIAAGLTKTVEQTAGECRDLEAELDRHVEHKPGFWISLSTFFRAGRQWYAKYERLAERLAKTKERREELAGALAQHKNQLTEALLARQRCENAIRDVEHLMAAARADIDAAAVRWPGAVPFGEHVDGDERFQLSTPWADQEFTAARNRVFLAALRLHKAFLLNAVSQMRGNLAVMCAALRGGVTMTNETSLAAWQAFFLVVPMVSTTFASLHRLFRGLGKESFGWLFIDEAGQATPQQAVGGLWRSRRAVIVGDPQQLEPIVTLPSSAQDAMRRYYDLSEEWSPDGTSVQRVADRLARHGTYLAEADGETTVWVGAPLRVHRRCDQPIFTVSNTVAYGGKLMVYGTADRPPFPGENVWLDVPTGQSRGNWVPAEGDALIAVFDHLRAHDVDTGEIRVISPFRDVVRGSKTIAARHVGQAFAADNVGTVHTVQGQESDVIVLVLGSAAANEGARRWAAATPNLLNVAVSRAKRRLYVIGDRDRWRSQPYFSTLAAAIEPRSTL